MRLRNRDGCCQGTSGNSASRSSGSWAAASPITVMFHSRASRRCRSAASVGAVSPLQSLSGIAAGQRGAPGRIRTCATASGERDDAVPRPSRFIAEHSLIHFRLPRRTVHRSFVPRTAPRGSAGGRRSAGRGDLPQRPRLSVLVSPVHLRRNGTGRPAVPWS